jgi:6-pyruvoyltetrahydropterin/6-carboxytetrahydropterin synthase
MTEFRVRVGKEALVFAAAHFITFGAEGCEPLHGHNYRVSVTLTGDLDRDSLVYDFIALKRDMERLIGTIDHRVLLPGTNPRLLVEAVDGQIEVTHPSRRYSFPESDVVILPVPNTTAEKIAEYLGEQLRDRLPDASARRIRSLEIEVEETPGQSALWTGPTPT